MSIKRWLVLLFIGLILLSLSGGYFLRAIYSLDYRFPWWMRYATLQFLSRETRGALFFVTGIAVTTGALLRLNHTVISALRPRSETHVIDHLYQQRQLRRGPKVVAIGGGTGLSIVLSGFKQRTSNLTAIVTVADDGGSSGKLRRELHIPPPGDFRQCLAALADVQPLMTALLQYRFRSGSGLEGHNLGNLMMAAMADITGNFDLGLREMGRVLAVRGQILPATLEDVALVAELGDRSYVHGESNMHQDHGSAGVTVEGRAPIERVFLRPAHAAGYPEAIQAMLDADIIVVGPGSLYTSVLPNLLVKDIARAFAIAPAYKVFVCNVATEPGETDQYSAADFRLTIEKHLGYRPFDAVVVNSRLDATRPPYWQSDVVVSDASEGDGVEIIEADVVDRDNALRHDSSRLTQVIVRSWVRHMRGGRHTSTAVRSRLA